MGTRPKNIGITEEAYETMGDLVRLRAAVSILRDVGGTGLVAKLASDARHTVQLAIAEIEPHLRITRGER